jgi:WD40 repeat protein
MQNPTTRDRDALIIAITQYSHLPMPPELTQLSARAEQIAQRLETQGDFRVTRLPATKQGDKIIIDPKQQVTADKIRPNISTLKSAIEQLLLPNTHAPPNTALIYFAGHGLRQQHKNGNTEGFLATSEADPDDNQWGLSLTWLRELLDKSPIKQQIVWIDACHSGEFINPTPPHTDHERCFVSSARPHEEAYAEGLLTQALLETLDYTQQPNPWVDHLTLIEQLQIKNQIAPGPQRFLFEKTDKPIILTNKAFDIKADYKNICPFKGLESFDFDKNPDDPLYFKGRSQLTKELLKKVQKAPFLAVLGASGNGKSSVVRAGLLYELRQRQRWAILPVITPTAHPLKALGTAIGMPAEQLTDKINQTQAERLVLVVDQFEEVFTLCQNEPERKSFFDILLKAQRAQPKFCLIIVMRADFLDKCSHHVDLAHKIQEHQVIVTPMTRAELEEAIVAPTQQVGLEIEPKLVSEMLADVKGALGSLPLLQYTLKELWKTCATQRLLTYSAYKALGKIAGTLEQSANRVYQNLSPAEQKTAQRIFIELTQLGEGSPDTRRQLSQQDLVTALPFESVPINQVIQKLVEANLLVTDKPKEEEVAVVNIAHEALTQHWGQMREWLDGNRDAIKIQREIEEDAKKWQDSNQSKSALLQGLDLNLAKDYVKTHTKKVPLSTLAQDFVKYSVKRQRHYWMGVVGSVVGVMLVLAGIAFYANEQRIEAEQKEKFAKSNFLTSQAYSKLQEDRTVAFNLAKAACYIQKTKYCTNLIIEASTGFPFYSEHNFSSLSMATISKKGEYIAVLSGDSIFLLNKDSSTPSLIFKNNANDSFFSPSMVSFTHDDNILFFAYGKVIIIDKSGNIVHSIPIDTSLGFRAVPSPTEPIFVFDSTPARIFNWDGAIIAQLEDTDSYYVEKAAFSKDGEFVVTIHRDRKAILWTKKGEKLDVFEGHGDRLQSAEFSDDNKWIVFGTQNLRTLVWDLENKQQSFGLTAQGIVHSSSVSPNRKFVAYSHDTLIKLHTLYGKAPLNAPLPWKELRAHTRRVTHVEFSPSGDFFISTGLDGKLKVWHLQSLNPTYMLQTELLAFFGSIEHTPQFIKSPEHEEILFYVKEKEEQYTVHGIIFSKNKASFSKNLNFENLIHFKANKQNTHIIVVGKKDDKLKAEIYKFENGGLVLTNLINLPELEDKDFIFSKSSLDYRILGGEERLIISFFDEQNLCKTKNCVVKYIFSKDFIYINHDKFLAVDKEGKIKLIKDEKSILSRNIFDKDPIAYIVLGKNEGEIVCATVSGKVAWLSIADLSVIYTIDTNKQIVSVNTSLNSNFAVIGTADGYWLLLEKGKKNMAKIQMPPFRSFLIDVFRLPSDSMQNTVYTINFIDNDQKIVTFSGDGIIRLWDIEIKNIYDSFNRQLPFGKIKTIKNLSDYVN